MPDADTSGSGLIESIRSQVLNESLLLTLHAQQEMVDEQITLDQIIEAVSDAVLIEHYPEHRRGACCLLGGYSGNRPLHIVCTTDREILIIITVYEPRPPKWVTPFERRNREL